MEPKIFQDELTRLGQIKILKNADQGQGILTFKPHQIEPGCPECFSSPGRDLVYQVKYDRKYRPQWWTKCRGCGQIFRGFRR